MAELNVTKDTKLHMAKELVASYLQSEAGKGVKPEQLGELLKTVYKSLDEAFPEPGERKIGLGV